MKQLTDEVFAQVRDAMVIAKNFCGSCTAEDCPDTVAIPINQALVALDTAQPAPEVNAGYGELEAVMSAEFESHGFGAPESNKREYGRFRVGFASGWHSALTAAKQAQSATVAHDELLTALRDNTLTTDQRSAIYSAMLAAKQAQPVCGYDDETGNCTRVNCCKQAQPERVTTAMVEGLQNAADKLEVIQARGIERDKCIAAFEQAQPERAPLSDDEIQTIYLRTYNEGFHGRNLEIAFARAIEAAIKQGGQHD